MLKKGFAALFILLLLALLAVYLFIPANLFIGKTVLAPTTEEHVFEFLTHQKQWKKWWPGKLTTADSQFQYKNKLYQIRRTSNDEVLVTISDSALSVDTHLFFMATDMYSTKISWTVAKKIGLNPFSRLNTYWQLKSISQDLNDILQHLKHFLESDRNIYQLEVKISKVKNPIILATKTVAPRYPETEEIYQMVAQLKKEVQKQHGAANGPPMLNVHQTAKNSFEIMVGIPVNETVKASGNTFINTMVLGNMMEAQVKGGLNTVRNALNELETYKKDHKLVSPAIPFESLITNRSVEKDTAKWITKIYYPIF